MKTIWKVVRREYMLRPILQLCFYKALAGVLVTVLWFQFLNHGVRGIGFGLTAVGLVLVCASWFSYLCLDENSYRNLLKRDSWKKPPKIKTADMIDYIETDPESFRELDKDEKHVAQFTSSLGTGLVFAIIGTIAAALF